MKIFNKDSMDFSNIINTVINDIEDFGSGIKSELEEINDSFEEKLKSVDDFFQKTNSKVSNQSCFSEKVKKRLLRQLEVISDEFDSENFELSFDIDDSDVLENYSMDPRKFIENKIDLDEHLDFIENKIEEISDRVTKISDFCDYKKPKHKLIIEKRNGIIAIKDRNHPNFYKNKESDISIDNEEVLFYKEGVRSSEYPTIDQWFVPQSTIDEFKIIKKRLQRILNN